MVKRRGIFKGCFALFEIKRPLETAWHKTALIKIEKSDGALPERAPCALLRQKNSLCGQQRRTAIMLS